jgi:pyruvate/2-oxoglutarate dehydrogenase complex dihydrolipoamide dehydrogenase (E3) component
LFTGCIPSKSLIASAQRAYGMRTADTVAVEPCEPGVDFARVMNRVQEVIRRAGVPDTPEHLEAQGVEVVRARGRFESPGVVEADGRKLRYRAAIIATGSRPAAPPISGLAEVDFLTNETVLDLRELPPRLTVLGGAQWAASSVRPLLGSAAA